MRKSKKTLDVMQHILAMARTNGSMDTLVMITDIGEKQEVS